jgi:4-amino-4-deoxy-L-arabinose transferase-like glycosyltransferase
VKHLPVIPAESSPALPRQPAWLAALLQYLQGHVRLLVLLQVALMGVFFFFRLAAYPLNDNNEGLYAEIAREMLQSGNYIIPHLNGLPYIEKPPLLYWLMAGSEALFGRTTFAARLVPAGSMFVLVVYCIYVGRRIGNLRLGMLGSLILSSSAAVALLSRTILFDPLLTALVGLALLQFYLWYTERRPAFLRAAYVLVGLGVLAKGIVAVVLCGAIMVLFLLQDARRRVLLRQLLDPWGLGLFLAVTAPWHIAAARALPEFSWFYFVNEHVLRFLGRRMPHDYYTGPIYYYIPRLLLLLFPWTPFVLLLFRGRSAIGTAPGGGHRFGRFCMTWFLVVFVFFSLSEAKANYYLMVGMPGMALWLATVIDAQMRSGRLLPLFYCSGAIFLMVLGLATALLTPWSMAQLHTHGMPESLDLEMALALIAVTALSALAMFYIRARRPVAGLAFLALTTVPLLLFTLSVLHSRADRISCAGMAQLIARATPGSVRIYAYKDYEDVFSTLRYYLPRPLYLIDSSSADLAFGCQLTGTRGPCQDLVQFMQYRRQHPVVVVIKDDWLAAFRQQGGSDGLVRIGHFGDRTVLASAGMAIHPAGAPAARSTAGGR